MRVMLFTDVHASNPFKESFEKCLGNWVGLGGLSRVAIARSLRLSEFSVSSQVHLPDNKKSPLGSAGFLSGFLICCQITDTATTTRPHVRECATTSLLSG
ncbi:hypothetical protein JFQ93_000281 [Aeromonas sobria]|nr:hypothetical protein [Aeromonas sobria]